MTSGRHLRVVPRRHSRPTLHHGEALALAARLRLSDADTARDARRALLLFWYGSGATHLRAEADVLLAAWERHGGVDHPLDAATRAAHAQLEAHVAAIAAEGRSDPLELQQVGEALARYVHRLDRELLGAVEHTVPPDELAAVADALDALRR